MYTFAEIRGIKSILPNFNQYYQFYGLSFRCTPFLLKCVVCNNETGILHIKNRGRQCWTFSVFSTRQAHHIPREHNEHAVTLISRAWPHVMPANLSGPCFLSVFWFCLHFLGMFDNVSTTLTAFKISSNSQTMQFLIDILSYRDAWLRYKNVTPHDDVIKLKHFPRCWPFVRGIHR